MVMVMVRVMVREIAGVRVRVWVTSFLDRFIFLEKVCLFKKSIFSNMTLAHKMLTSCTYNGGLFNKLQEFHFTIKLCHPPRNSNTEKEGKDRQHNNRKRQGQQKRQVQICSDMDKTDKIVWIRAYPSSRFTPNYILSSVKRLLKGVRTTEYRFYKREGRQRIRSQTTIIHHSSHNPFLTNSVTKTITFNIIPHEECHILPMQEPLNMRTNRRQTKQGTTR